MAKYIVIILVFLLQTTSWAVEEFRYYSKSQYTKIKMVHVERWRVNELCQKKISCMALKVARGPARKILAVQSSTYGNPAANYCWDVGAKNRILKDSKNNEYDFCVFDDGSMIDAWNLYAKHYPPKRIK